MGQYVERRVAAGAVSLILVLGTVAWSANKEVAVARTPHVYQGPGCDITATFPGTPNISKVTVPGVAYDGEQAELDAADIYLRAECSPNLTQPFGEAELRAMIERYAADNGFHDPHYDIKPTSDIPPGPMTSITTGGFTADKTIDGKLITFEVQVTISSKSMLTMIAAGPADLHPMPARKEFLRSVAPSSQ